MHLLQLPAMRGLIKKTSAAAGLGFFGLGLRSAHRFGFGF